MFTRIEALNFRALRYVKQPLGPFHVLVGPNASGKTTFLDVIAFLGQFVSQGLDAAIRERTRGDFRDLLWMHSGDRFELAVEAKVPEECRRKTRNAKLDTLRYEVVIGLDTETNQPVVINEKVSLRIGPSPIQNLNGRLFPHEQAPPQTLVNPPRARNTQLVINTVQRGSFNYYSESQRVGRKWASFQLGNRRSALANLPEDESRFPASLWFKAHLATGVQQFVLNSLVIRNASPPGRTSAFLPDGSNLPWVVDRLRSENPDRFRQWVEHVQTALPDLESVRTVERPDDRHRYLVLCYRGGLEVPSWMASDGTLCLLALTLPAYLADFSGVYLIEEPENGIHPRAVSTMLQSLTSVYTAQILLATHSPVILGEVEPDTVLCFAKTPGGSTDIVAGDRHPKLRDWRRERNLGVLFASGVLG